MAAIVVRSTPKQVSNYDAHREELRRDFYYSCAYCHVTEFESRGFGFSIDHYRPQLHGGGDSYDNLYWACVPCNRKKESYWPSPTSHAAGNYIIRVDVEDPDDHIEVDAASRDRVTSKTTTGDANIAVLDLNSLRLRRIRDIRRRFGFSEKAVANGLRKLALARVDQLPTDLKKLTFKLREELKARAADVPSELAELVRATNKSELLDFDDEAVAHTKQRKRFLEKSGALPTRRKRNSS